MPRYQQGADLPDTVIDWRAFGGNLIDFSSGWTFTIKVAKPGQPAAFTKTSGVTGAATSPNITIGWLSTGELNDLAPGAWTVYITAVRASDSKERKMKFVLVIDEGGVD